MPSSVKIEDWITERYPNNSSLVLLKSNLSYNLQDQLSSHSHTQKRQLFKNQQILQISTFQTITFYFSVSPLDAVADENDDDAEEDNNDHHEDNDDDEGHVEDEALLFDEPAGQPRPVPLLPLLLLLAVGVELPGEKLPALPADHEALAQEAVDLEEGLPAQADRPVLGHGDVVQVAADDHAANLRSAKKLN